MLQSDRQITGMSHEVPGTLQPFADNFIPVIPIDYPEHTPGRPFCWNPTCPCHEDDEEIAAVNQGVQDGLLTTDEATDFVLGKLV